MSTAKQWPAYRRTLAPPGICIHCWKRGGAPVMGEPFAWDFPSSTHPGEGPPIYYCARCQIDCREMGIVLIPVPREAGSNQFLSWEQWCRLDDQVDRVWKRAGYKRP